MRAIGAGAIMLGLSSGLSMAQPAPDLARAKDLYKSAEAATKDGRFVDAARDYGGAYEITKDPVLFFKIGSANEKAGKCEAALIYYNRYLREAHPSDSFVQLTRERIKICGGDPDKPPEPVPPTPNPGPNTNPDANPGAQPPAGVDMNASPTPTPTPVPAPKTIHPSNRVAWVLVAGSVAFITVGSVLAYAANSSENDVTDLYVGLQSFPPSYDARTKQQYQDLIDEGHRYQHLSWLSFGLAGAAAVGAGVLFYLHAHDHQVEVAPAASPTSAGVSASLRF